MTTSLPPLVQRFCVHEVPLPTNRAFRPHETANLVVFIREEGREEGRVKLTDILSRERWQPLSMEVEDRLIEDRVRADGGEVWKAYKHALKHGDYVKVCPDHFGAGKKNDFGARGPRLDEAFIDQVILQAGGQRYQPDGPESRRPRNADYLIEDLILELKDIQENALAKASRQKRLADVMRRGGFNQQTVLLDPDLLSNIEDRQEFIKIIGEPIERAIKSASRQIQKTRESLRSPQLRGGLILINTGTHIYSHDLFVDTCKFFASKPGRRVDELFCFTTSFHSNGFDHRVDFASHPAKPENALQEKILGSFWDSIGDFMTNWAREMEKNEINPLHPHQALAFDSDGQTFYWLPERVPSTLGVFDPSQQ